MDVLEKQYRERLNAYDRLIAQTIRDPSKISSTLPQIQAIQTQMSSIVDKMIGEVTLAKQGDRLAQRRNELIEQLQRIQRDYTDLRNSSDKLETLRRIRAFEDQSWQGTFQMYLIAFIVFVVVVALVLIFKRIQAPAINAMTPSNPTAITPLT